MGKRSKRARRRRAEEGRPREERGGTRSKLATILAAAAGLGRQAWVLMTVVATLAGLIGVVVMRPIFDVAETSPVGNEPFSSVFRLKNVGPWLDARSVRAGCRLEKAAGGRSPTFAIPPGARIAVTESGIHLDSGNTVRLAPGDATDISCGILWDDMHEARIGIAVEYGFPPFIRARRYFPFVSARVGDTWQWHRRPEPDDADAIVREFFARPADR